MTFLLENVSTDTSGSKVDIGIGSKKTISIWATNFGAGTVSLQVSPDNGTNWILLKKIDGTDATFTSNDHIVVDSIGEGNGVRAVLSGSDGSTSGVNVKMANA